MRYCYLEDKQVRSCNANPDFDAETEICVVGLGTAGAIAAIAAAERGASVLAIERLTTMGGLGTAGCVWDYYYGNPGGRFEKINEECRALEQYGYAKTTKGSNYDSFCGAVKSLVLERNADECKCDIRYETVPVGVFLDRQTVVGLRIFSRGTFRNIRTKVIIDSTGDALISRMAGCELQAGRKLDNKLMVCSNAISAMKESLVGGRWRHCGRVDNTDEAQVSQNILESSAAAPCLLAHYTPDSRTVVTSAVYGIRNTFDVVTEQILTLKDHIAGYQTKEPLFYAFAPLDNPNRDMAFESASMQDWHLICLLYNYGFSVGVPLGVMLPKGVDGVIIAGKGIGVDYDLSSCVRMKKDMEKCGEAAAVAACMAIESKCTVRDVPYEKLACVLNSSGCLDEANHTGLCDLRHVEGKGYRPVKLFNTQEEVKKRLETALPGLAFWSLPHLQSEGCLDWLREWMQSDDRHLKYNSAIAAGMLGDRSACALLREMAGSPPAFPLEHDVPQYYVDYARALCLLGRLKDEQSAELLIELILDNGQKASEALPVDSFYKTAGDWAFQFVSLAMISLIQIAKQHPELEPRIVDVLKEHDKKKQYPKHSSDDLYNIQLDQLL